jgi:hypothetical protein
MRKDKFSILRQASLIYLIEKDIQNGENEKAQKKIDILLSVLNGKGTLQGISQDFIKELPKLRQEAENDIGT